MKQKKVKIVTKTLFIYQKNGAKIKRSVTETTDPTTTTLTLTTFTTGIF